MRVARYAFLLAVAVTACGAPPVPAQSVLPITAPRVPLPSEAASMVIKKFSFIAYGDTRGRRDGMALQAEHSMVMDGMVTAIKKASSTDDPIRFVVQSGDAVVNGSIGSQLTVSYIPIIERLAREVGVPYFLSVGNHDVGSSDSLTNPRRVEGLRNFFAANQWLLPPEGPRRLRGYPTYAFGFGNTFFIAFDSNIPDDTVQFAWVSRQLQQLDRAHFPNVAIFFHHPPFSSGPHGGPTVERNASSIRAIWMPLFRKHHVRLLLTGHEHLYEHWVERYTDASGPHRIDQIVTGGGGAPHYAYTGEPDLADYLDVNSGDHVTLEHVVKPSPDAERNPYHFVIVHVDGDRISLEVIGVGSGADFMPYGTTTTVLGGKAP